MTTSPSKVETPARPDPVQAVATFFREDPARILAVASSLRGPDRAVESTVEGLSMGRSLPAGSRIRIALVDRSDYEVGEVVTFVAGGQLIVHRVVHRGRRGAGRGYLVTRGDITLAPDAPVHQDSILGAVTGVRREGRWVAPDGPPRRSFPARLARAVLLMAVASLLRMSPRAALTLSSVFHRLEKSLREAMWGTRSGKPQGSVPSGAA
jgi:hypothetical protein